MGIAAADMGSGGGVDGREPNFHFYPSYTPLGGMQVGGPLDGEMICVGSGGMKDEEELGQTTEK